MIFVFKIRWELLESKHLFGKAPYETIKINEVEILGNQKELNTFELQKNGVVLIICGIIYHKADSFIMIVI